MTTKEVLKTMYSKFGKNQDAFLYLSLGSWEETESEIALSPYVPYVVLRFDEQKKTASYLLYVGIRKGVTSETGISYVDATNKALAFVNDFDEDGCLG